MVTDAGVLPPTHSSITLHSRCSAWSGPWIGPELRTGSETVETQKTDGMSCRAIEGEIGEYLPYHRGEFEAVPREPARNNDIGMARVLVYNEVMVGRH